MVNFFPIWTNGNGHRMEMAIMEIPSMIMTLKSKMKIR